MNRKNMILLGFLIFFIVSIPNISAFDEQIKENVIRISELNDSFQVKEKITYIIPQDENNSFFIILLQDQSTDLKIYVENNVINEYDTNENQYTVNLTALNLSSSKITVDVSYFIPIGTTLFSKTFSYNTSSIEILYENVKIFSSENQFKESDLQVKLTRSTEEASIQMYTIILIILLVIIIIVTAWYAFFRKKNGKSRQRNFESSEVLTTEKKLLLDVLKEIEKMHRNEKISDDSYHKLKTHYKQETVDIMSALEDMKSK